MGESIWEKPVVYRALKGGKSLLVVYHSIDLSPNVTLLSVPFPPLGSELQAGITSYAPLSLSAPWTEAPPGLSTEPGTSVLPRHILPPKG